MATREASLKITIQPNAFQSGIRRMTNMVRKSGFQMRSTLSQSLKKGFEAGKEAAKDMGAGIKDTLKTAATLGGAISVGAAVKTALDAEEAYTQLSGALEMYSGKNVKAAEAQAMVGNVAKRTKLSIGSLVENANQLAAVPIEEFESSLERSQMQAKRLGVQGELTARVYSRLMSSGIAKTAEEAEILTERMNKFGRTALGLDVDEAIDPNDMAEFASFVNLANSEAGKMMNILEMTGGALAKDLGQSIEFIEEFGNVTGTDRELRALRESAKLGKDDIVDTGDAFENFLQVATMGGEKGARAFTAFADAFGNERSTKMLEQLFGKKLSMEIVEGKATKLALDERAEELRGVYNATFNEAKERQRIEKQDAAIKATASASFREAMNKITTALASPKMIAALDKLADKLPALADTLASVIEWIADNPWSSIAAIVGGKIGLAFAGGALKEAVMSALLGGKGGAIAGRGGGLVGAAGRGVVGLGKGVVAAGASSAVGSALGGGAVAGTAVAGGAVLAAGAAGAGIGYAIHKGLAEGSMDAEEDWLAKASSTSTVTAKFAQTKEELESFMAQIATTREGLKESESTWNTVWGSVAATFSDAKAPQMRRLEAMEQLRKAEQVAKERMDELARASSQASAALSKVGGGSTTRGPALTPGTMPGADPAGG